MTKPNFGMARVLRPFPTLTTVYQGLSCRTPIAWLPTNSNYEGVASDPLAGTEAYSPSLMNALPVVLGSTVHLWLPRIIYVSEAVLNAHNETYTWILGWRMRTLNCFKMKRAGGYHLPFSKERAAKAGINGRIPIPFVYEGVVYEQTEQSGLTQEQHYKDVEGLMVPDFQFNLNPLLLPRLPDATNAAMEQGVYVGGGGFVNTYPTYMHMTRVAKGDELVVMCYRSNTGVGATYDFAGVDLNMATIMSSSPATLTGVFVLGGTEG